MRGDSSNGPLGRRKEGPEKGKKKKVMTYEPLNMLLYMI